MKPLHELRLHRPATLAEAAALLARDDARAIGGGTDLLPNLRRGLDAPRHLVDLGGLDAGSGYASIDPLDGGWRLGGGVTLATIERSAVLAAALPALVQAAGAVAGPGHRSAATLAGNLCQDTRCVFYNQSAWWRGANGWCLKRAGDTCHVAPQGSRCHAAFEGDVAPALMVHGATLEIVAAGGTRRLPLAELYRDDGAAHLTLAPGELLAAIHVPAPTPGTRCGYRKARARAAMDFPLAGAAAALRVEDGRLLALAVAITGTNSQPFLLEGTEALLGHPLDDERMALLSKLVQKQVKPMRSTVTQSNYRRLVAATTAQRLVRDLAGAA